MTNADVWASGQDYTKELTVQSRKLAFGGAAICWFFKTAEATFPKPILFALLLIVVFFLLDMAQYFLAANGIRTWMLGAERDMWEKFETIEGDYSKPAHLDQA